MSRRYFTRLSYIRRLEQVYGDLLSHRDYWAHQAERTEDLMERDRLVNRVRIVDTVNERIGEACCALEQLSRLS